MLYEVITPGVVWDSAKGVWQFHTRESEKMLAYDASGEKRAQMLAAARSRLAELEPLEVAAQIQLAGADTALEAHIEAKLVPLKEAYELKKTEFRKAQKDP